MLPVLLLVLSRCSNRMGTVWLCAMVGLTLVLSGCGNWPDDTADSVGRKGDPLVPVAGTPARPRDVQLGILGEGNSGNTVVGAVERGSGRFVQSASHSRATMANSGSDGISLNVADADVRDLVRLVLDETLHVNYIIDPAVNGKITVHTSQPVRAADLSAILDAILRVNGAALVQVGDLYKIVPIEQALTSGPAADIHPVSEAGRPGFAVLVVPVHFVSAAALAPLLKPFAPPGSSLQVDAGRNLLLLGGTREELSTVTDLVSTFDVDWLAGMSFGLYPLNFVRPAQLVSELEQIFDLKAGPAGGLVRFVPIERLKAVLVMSNQPAYLERAEAWIQRLDQAGEDGETQVFVYAVQNGRAADLGQVLGKIFSAKSAAVGPRDLLAPGLQPASIGSGLTDGEKLENVNTAQPIPSDPMGQSTQLSTGERPEVQIVADATTNSLVIRATPAEYGKIRKALEQLDILPLQVLIEATVAEVTLKNDLRYGVEWFLRSGDFAATLSQRGENGLVGSLFPGFSAVFSNDNAKVVLDALESVTDVDVVSSPHLLVLDNQTARIQVGDQVPISVQQATSVTDPAAPIVNSIELRDTGVILSVTPRVNTSGSVVMELRQEVSNVARSAQQTTTSEQSTPTISQRQISSTVAVQSGETIVLGGLIQDNHDNSVSGVPFLSRLPIIGSLFGTQSHNKSRTELLVLLTPRVIRGVAEARAVTDELRRRLRSLGPLTQNSRSGAW
jgi:general secretion pathway protein D